MKSIDPLLNRQYDAQKYHCVHFVIEAAQYLFERDYSSSFLGLTGSLKQAVDTSKNITIQNKQLEKPIDGCVVLMMNLMNQSHVGLFYCGHVLHLTENGTHFQTLRILSRYYSRFRYYETTHI